MSKTPTFLENLKNELLKSLQNVDYSIFSDSTINKQDFHSNEFIIVIEKKIIEIKQLDWRDRYYIYEVFNNKKKIFEIDLSETEPNDVVKLAVSKIKLSLGI